MHLDPTSLRLFISVIEEKTIAAAAEREHIAAAAVSKRMSELEEQLKTQLLVRTNKGIQPTNAGMALAAMARRALRELDDVAVSMREYASGARGFIRVFANISALTQFLPGDIRSFAAAYPNIQLQLEEKISPVILKAVHENAADVGIFSGMPPSRDVEVLPYRRDTLALIAPAHHPCWRSRISVLPTRWPTTSSACIPAAPSTRSLPMLRTGLKGPCGSRCRSRASTRCASW